MGATIGIFTSRDRSIGAVTGIAIGVSMWIVGNSYVLRWLGAVITGGGLLCAVVRFAGKN